MTDLYGNAIQDQKTSFIIKASLAAVGLLFAATMWAGTGSAASKAETATLNGNKLQCFSGHTDLPGVFNGTCKFEGNSAVLNTDDGDGLPNNNYAGVYLSNSNLGGKLLTEVNKLSFTYDGTGSAGGSPRVSIPIDDNNDGNTHAFAFADTQVCTDGTADKGTLDVINDPTCTISYENQQFANWSEFVAAHPTFRIAKDNVTFVIVDQPGNFTITNVQLGKGPAKPAKTEQ